MADDYQRCANCGARIELINFALGPEWRHWPTPYGNWNTREKYRDCRMGLVASPDHFQHRGAVMTIFNTASDLSEFIALKGGDPWFAVVDRIGEPFLIFGAEDDDAWQGIPMEGYDDGEEPDRANGSLDSFRGSYPLTLLVPSPPISGSADSA